MAVIITRRKWTRQPTVGVPTVRDVEGYAVGATIVGGQLDVLNGKSVLTLSTAIRIDSGLLAWSSATYGGVYAQTPTPFVLGTQKGGTLVTVFRARGSAGDQSAIAGLGSSSGGSGNTLLYLRGSYTVTDYTVVVQDASSNVAYSLDSSGVVKVNDQRWHTAVASFGLGSGASAYLYTDGLADGSASVGSSVSATTFDYVNAGGVVRGGSLIAEGSYDVALLVPIFGQISRGAAADISANPWQLFEPRTRRLYVGASGAASSPPVGRRYSVNQSVNRASTF